MRRLLALITLVVAVGVVVALGTGAGGGEDEGGGYKVRAIFRNAFSVIPGEDVKIAGVKVGSIDALDVTPDHKAVVVLEIDEAGFQDFRSDAVCTIRPQSLIGEKFVECTPTQPREHGAAPAPALRKIEDGPGEGQYLLPVTQTRKPVDLDLVNNIMRRPYRERLSIILNELGVGLAANGEDLRQAIRNANPALEETDKVLAILAEQNRVLADLARDGDEALRPLARDRERVASLIDKANTTAQASAERRSDIEATLRKLPDFLRELRPTMQRLGGLADEVTPVLTDLGDAAPSISKLVEQLGPFSEAGIPAVTSLGDAADVGKAALLQSKPVVTDLGTFAERANPLTKDLSELLTSLRGTGGVERLMDFLFYSAAAVNGFDSFGHYLRAVLVVNTCSAYVTENDPACTANFTKPQASASARTASRPGATKQDVDQQIASGRSPYLAGQDAVLRGLGPEALKASQDGDSSGSGSSRSGSATATREDKTDLPAALLPGQPAGEGRQQTPTQTLLDYLLG